MRTMFCALVLLLLFVCCTGSVLAQQPFTYQGMLKASGVPANGNYDFQFSLWTANSGGSQVGSTLTRTGVSVSNGLFTTELDFGNVWDGADRYLQIAVRPSGSGSYTTLSPRVKVNRAPYSQLAYSALTVPWSGIIGVPSSFPPGGPAGGDLSGTYPAPVVVGVQGRPVASAAPGAGQVLKWDGAQWSPSDDLRDAFWQASGSDIFYTAGRVGIGTSGPAYQLHVETSVATCAIFGHQKGTAGSVSGVYGSSESTSGMGVVGSATATSGNTRGGYFIVASTSGWGVVGYASASSGTTYGVLGNSASPDGTGVYGVHVATSGTAPGVHGVTYSTSSEAVGVLGAVASTSPGASSAGVRGINRGTGGSGIGVWGSQDGSGFGVYGSSVSGRGVFGRATATSGVTYGVLGQSDSPNGYGVYSVGRFAATGTKSFQIDHPLDPENAVLNHYSAEGPEPYNIYRGTVVLDARGEAWVLLPDYFEAINRDPSYHLTAIGAPMPNLHVAVEVQGNRFKIAGGAPGKKVSWEVKAIRSDRWVQEYGYQTEQPKPRELRGKYLHPELYGQPKELGIHYHPELERGVTPAAPVTK